jgi:hypothetical protein
MAARRFVLLLLLLLASSASAFGLEHHHWQKKSVMNNTGCNAPPTWGFGVPPETWGWFGVHYWPRQGWHRGYYGGQREWGYRQGY